MATAATDVVTLAITAGSVSVVLSGSGSYTEATGVIAFDDIGETAVVTALADDTVGTWALTSGTPSIAITEDSDGNATLDTSDVFVLTVTATVTGWHEATETRVYEVVPRRD